MPNSTIIDLTREADRRRLTRLVQEEEDFATQLIRHAPDGIAAFDRDMRYTIWNPAMERLTGLSTEQAVGHRVFELFPFLADNGLETLFHEAMAGRHAAAEFGFTIAETGMQGYVQSFTSPLRNELGEVVGGLCIVRDTTERRQAYERIKAQFEEKKRELERSHEALKFLAEAGTALASTLDHTQVEDAILRLSMSHFRGTAILRLVREDGILGSRIHDAEPWRAELTAEIDRVYPACPDRRTGPYQVLHTGKSMWIPQFSDIMFGMYAVDKRHLDLLLKLGLKSYICVPLATRGRILGTLSVSSPTETYTLADAKIAEELGRRCALALDNARLYAQAIDRSARPLDAGQVGIRAEDPSNHPADPRVVDPDHGLLVRR